MAQQIQVRMVLTGPKTGITGMVDSYWFEGGVCNVQMNSDNLGFFLRKMGRFYQAFPAGSDDLKRAEAHYQSLLEQQKAQANQAQVDAEASKAAKELIHGISQLQTSGQLPKTAEDVQGGLQPDGPGPAPLSTADGTAANVPEGGGQGLDTSGGGQQNTRDDGKAGAQSGNDQIIRLQNAIRSLDPADDELWTVQGLPAMQAVEDAYGEAGLTRREVEAVMPGWNRERAIEEVAKEAAPE